MHLVLSLIFCGCMKSFKDSWMDYIEDHLDYVRVLNHIGGDHESERTRPYREKIMDHFGPKEIVFESDAPKFANRLKTRMAWMRLFNGDWSKQRITHYCRGCCIDRADCVRQIRCNVVAPHPKPEGWARARWLGSEDAVDWAGQLTYCHGMLRPVYLKSCFNVRWDSRQGCRHGLDDVGQEAEENGDEEDGDHAQPGGEHRYEELDKQMTTMERHKTFRKNAKLWLDSAPEGRLLILKQVHHIQQSSQTKLLSQCGVTWEVNQLKKEASGKGSAAFRCLLLHDGEYTTKFMSKYNQLTRSPDL